MKIAPHLTLILFDLDGTLLDTSALYFAGVPPIVARHLGQVVDRGDLLPLWGQHARRFFEYFAARSPGAGEGLTNRMYAEFETFYNACHNDLAVVYDGVDAALLRLRRSGFRTGVVTTRPSSRSGPVLALPLADSVDFFVWGDAVARAKPAPDGLDKAMAAYGRTRVNGIYLGDNAHDIEAARHSAYPMLAAAALWDAMDRDRLLAAGPDHSFENFQAFTDWILERRLP